MSNDESGAPIVHNGVVIGYEADRDEEDRKERFSL